MRSTLHQENCDVMARIVFDDGTVRPGIETLGYARAYVRRWNSLVRDENDLSAHLEIVREKSRTVA
jgi:hypothetical protein